MTPARIRELEDSICRIAGGVVVGVTLLLAAWLAGGVR